MVDWRRGDDEAMLGTDGLSRLNKVAPIEPDMEAFKISIQARSSSSGTHAFAYDSCVRAKNHIPKKRRHAEIAILEAMMREVPHLC